MGTRSREGVYIWGAGLPCHVCGTLQGLHESWGWSLQLPWSWGGVRTWLAWLLSLARCFVDSR